MGSNGLELASLKKSLPCVALGQARKHGRHRERARLCGQRERPRKGLQLTIDCRRCRRRLLSGGDIVTQAHRRHGNGAVHTEEGAYMLQVRLELRERPPALNLIVAFDGVKQLLDRDALLLGPLERPNAVSWTATSLRRCLSRRRAFSVVRPPRSRNSLRRPGWSGSGA
jgi:hypothetical protein